jgi:hypothetical protein
MRGWGVTQTAVVERRQHQRKVKPFFVAFSTDGVTFVPAYGLDISSGGVGVLTQLHTPDGEFRLRIMLEERDFIVKVVRQRETEQIRDGKTWYGTGLRFTEIDPEDAAFVAAFVRGLEERPRNRVLGEIEQAFTTPDAAVDENKRAVKRRKKPFYIAFSVNEILFIPAYGLDVGRDGMRILTEVQMPDDPFSVRTILHGRQFLAKIKKSWDKQIEREGKANWITGARFTEISPADRELIDCYVEDKPYITGNKLFDALERLRLEPDQADLLLPRELLDAFLRRLVELKRLAPVRPRSHPLVRYHYEGTRNAGDFLIHVLRIESRVIQADSTRRYSTRFSFDETGGKIQTL